LTEEPFDFLVVALQDCDGVHSGNLLDAECASGA
jgi:hypothetical protein